MVLPIQDDGRRTGLASQREGVNLGNTTLGALSFDYLDIGEQIAGTGFFGAVLLDFNIYF